MIIKVIKSVAMNFNGFIKMQWNVIIIISVIAISFSSCTKDYTELNTPENQIATSNIDANLLGQAFAKAQYEAAAGVLTSYIWCSELYAMQYAQYHANMHPIFTSDQFEQSGPHTDRWWTGFYGPIAPQIDLVVKSTEEGNMPLENAIAKVERVFAFHLVTDHFGPIIYSQSGNGQTSVAYDSQEDVYKSFFKTLDEAVAVLKTNTGGTSVLGNNDQMYNGNVNLWLKFANSLRLRLAMRIVYAEPDLAKAEAEKAVSDGVMVSNDESGLVKSTVNSLNGLSTTTYHEEWRMSATMMSLLVGWNDPRITMLTSPRWDGGAPRGLRNGVPLAQRDIPSMSPIYTPVNLRYRPLYAGAWGGPGDNEPNPTIVAPEVYFLRAEGALRGWSMGGTAKDLYEEGIRTSISSLLPGASTTEIDNYINGTSLPVAQSDNWSSPRVTDIPVKYQESADFETQLEQIITQKWLAIYPNGFEAWAERRRTGYPKGYAILESINSNLTRFEIPRRRLFPPIEASANAVEFENAKQLLGGPDNISTRLWWDKKPIASFPTPTD